MTMTEMSPLRWRMIEDMTIRNLSPATQRSYLHAVAKFPRYFGRSPDRLGLEEVRAFQVHLVSSGLSWPALNQTVCALRFFFGVTLGHAEIPERIAYARTPAKLPTIRNGDEIVRFLEAVPSLRTRTALTTAYAAGLRASEAVHLQVRDIDGERGIIRVEHGKGGKDRNVCCQRSCLRSCGPIGGWRDPRSAVSGAGRDQAHRRSGSVFCLPFAVRCGRHRQTGDGAYAAPPISWKAEPTSASSRFCLATTTCPPRRVTRRFPIL
jgi:site-specific recombinase XerC